MAGSSGAIIAACFILSLFFSTFFIAYFNQEFNGDNSLEIVKLPNTLPSYLGAQDYLSGKYNASIQSITGIGNDWVFHENEGMYHRSISPIPSQNYFFISNLQKSSNNIYVNTYIINNSVKHPYTIVLRGTSNFDQNDIYIDDEGFHIPSYSSFGIWKGETSFISYPNAAQVIHPKIITTYYEGGTGEDSICDINFDGQSFRFSQLNRQDFAISLIIRNIYYAGISSNYIGTVLEYFSSENLITNPDVKVSTSSDPLSLIASLIPVMLKLATYTFPYTIIPLEYQAILIAPQEFMILIGVALFLRQA